MNRDQVVSTIVAAAAAAGVAFATATAQTTDVASQTTLESLAETQRADALANCNADDDQNGRIRETILDLMPDGPQRDAALARFPDKNCEEEIGGASD